MTDNLKKAECFSQNYTFNPIEYLCCPPVYVITWHVSQDWFSSASTDFWCFFFRGPAGKHGMPSSPCLITPALPFHSSQPPPSHLPILCEPHQSKSSSRIANSSDGSTSPGDPEVEEFFAAYWGHFCPPPHSPSLSLRLTLSRSPPKMLFLH